MSQWTRSPPPTQTHRPSKQGKQDDDVHDDDNDEDDGGGNYDDGGIISVRFPRAMPCWICSLFNIYISIHHSAKESWLGRP